MAKNNLVLGIDIGSHSVKVCQLKPSSGGKNAIIALGSAMLPEGSINDGNLESPEEVSDVLGRLLKNLKIKNKKIGFSISGYSVIVKKISLAIMKPAELEEHIMEEAEQYIPFDIDDVYIDFQDLHTSTQSDDRTDVMLVAAKKDVVDDYLNMFTSLKLTPVLVDIDGFAFQNSYKYNYSENENVALIDIGASKMNINILACGVSAVARDILLGSNLLTDELADALGVDIDEAEAIKIGTRQAPDMQKIIVQVFNKTCTRWVLEIKKAIDLYQANNPKFPLNHVILSGGGSKVVGLTNFLASETGVPVDLFNPFINLLYNRKKIDPVYLKSIGPEMAIATGLALRTSVI
ncbi:MAG: pilus assembly protein PilM [Desulforhopalus sp.]|nr:pilus assembly protein PilM [Desulforhopalus sp.]